MADHTQVNSAPAATGNAPGARSYGDPTLNDSNANGPSANGGQGSSAFAAELKRLNLDESTIPDAFESVPKIISPRAHAWLDAAVTAYFLGLGAWFVSQGKKGPAVAAFINAGMVAGVSAFTDYEGTGEKPISFKMHGTLDAFQAATAAIAPALHGFGGEPEAALFYGQAVNELAVIATTDWDRGMPNGAHRE